MVRVLGWRSKVRGFEFCQEHKKNFDFFRVKNVLNRCRSECLTPVCIRTHTKDHVYTLKILQSISEVDYGNTKITSMHLYPRRGNVAAQVAEEFKTVTYATPMEERRKRRRVLCIHTTLHCLHSGTVNCHSSL